MQLRRTVGALLLVAAIPAAPLKAQYRDRVSTYDRSDARVVVREDVHRAPIRRVVAPAPRVIVVERLPRDWRGWRAEEWARRGYRRITVYRVDDRYYDRYDQYARSAYGRGRAAPVVQEVVVYERDGRYYASDDRWDDRRDRREREWERKHREWHDKHDRDRYDD